MSAQGLLKDIMIMLGGCVCCWLPDGCSNHLALLLTFFAINNQGPQPLAGLRKCSDGADDPLKSFSCCDGSCQEPLSTEWVLHQV